MNINALIIWLVFIAITTISCDPTKLIILKNKSDKPAQVTWIMNADSVSYDSANSRFRTITFNLGTRKSDREQTMVFGFGNWPASVIERFVNEEMRSIQIETSASTFTITDKDEMKRFLLSRRKGLFKNFIVIKVR